MLHCDLSETDQGAVSHHFQIREEMLITALN
jgi:hypothetical protein